MYWDKKGEKLSLKKIVSQEVFLPHCLQKPTRLADGLGLGVSYLSTAWMRPIEWIPRIRMSGFRLLFYWVIMYFALLSTLIRETLSRI